MSTSLKILGIIALLVVTPVVAAADEPRQLEDEDRQEATADADAPTFDRLGVEEPTATARAGLAAGQTVHGFALGIETCVMLECDGPRPWTAAMTLGAGAGLGLSLWATADGGITPGQARALNHGALWGGVAGFTGGAGVMQLDGRPLAGLMIGTQLAGMGAGWGLSQWLRPTSGDVLLSSVAGLTTFLYYPLITEGVLELRQRDRMIAGGMLASLAVGQTGGALIAGQEPMSTGRVLLVTAGGAVGTLLGVAVPFMIVGDALTARVGITSGIVGNLAGYGLTGYLTRDWDAGEGYGRPDASVTIQPIRQGQNSGAAASITGRW